MRLPSYEGRLYPARNLIPQLLFNLAKGYLLAVLMYDPLIIQAFLFFFHDIRIYPTKSRHYSDRQTRRRMDSTPSGLYEQVHEDSEPSGYQFLSSRGRTPSPPWNNAIVINPNERTVEVQSKKPLDKRQYTNL